MKIFKFQTLDSRIADFKFQILIFTENLRRLWFLRTIAIPVLVFSSMFKIADVQDHRQGERRYDNKL